MAKLLNCKLYTLAMPTYHDHDDQGECDGSGSLSVRWRGVHNGIVMAIEADGDREAWSDDAIVAAAGELLFGGRYSAAWEWAEVQIPRSDDELAKDRQAKADRLD